MRGQHTPPSLAAWQAGVFTTRQAYASGYSPYQVRRLVDDQRWVVLLGTVLTEAGTPLSPASLGWAAQLAAGMAGIVSHTTAARVQGYRVPPDPEVHLIVARDARPRVPGLRAHRVAIEDADITVVDGLSCTTASRTLLDCLLWLPEEAGRALMTDALQQRSVDIADLRRSLMTCGPRHGIGRAWSVLKDVGRGAHSEAEVRAHRLLTAAGLTGWKANVEIHDDGGVIGIADVVFRSERIVIEIDGRAYHVDEVTFQRDRSRQNRLVSAGYVVLRFTWDDLVRRPEVVIGTVRGVLADATRRQR